MTLLDATIRAITPQDQAARHAARERLSQLTMPYWALGRLMDLAEDLAGMTGSIRPSVKEKSIVVMAADHGVTAEGVSAYPQEVTVQMVANFVAGGAGINALSRQVGARVVVVDMGVAGELPPHVVGGSVVTKRIGPGTRNMALGPAMTREEALRSVEAGIEVALDLSRSTDVLGVGEMGIGNTTASSAIVAACSGLSAAEVTGRGTGVGDEQLRHKIRKIEDILSVNRPDPADALDLLSKVGGFELGGIAGLVLGAASLRKPVLVDGFVSTAGAVVAHRLCSPAADYMIASHLSVEQGHRVALDLLGKKPLLDLDLRLGEGTGAALAMNLVEAAVRILTEVATFEEASVSRSDRDTPAAPPDVAADRGPGR